MISNLFTLFNEIMPYAMSLTIILFLAGLGGLISERAGVVNIALDGLMIIGAFSSAIFTVMVVEPNSMGVSGIWLSLFIAGLAGAFISIFHAVASITLSANQVISGTAINMFAPAVTVFFARYLTGTKNVSVMTGIPRKTYPHLSQIPIIGPWFFDKAYATTFAAIILAVIIWYVLFKTSFGLRLRACGEHPQAADSMGINVQFMRYVAVISSGFLAGIAGGLYIMTTSKLFGGSVDGLGFLALAALIFGKWKPLNVFFAAFYFAFMKNLGVVASSNPLLQSIHLPMEVYNMLPYVMTILALMIFSRDIVGPKAAGEPYEKGKR